MKKIIFPVVCLLIIFSLVGCGGSGPAPGKHTYAMEISVTEQSMQTSALNKAGAIKIASVAKTPDWWVDKPENGFFSYIVRSSSGELSGSVEAVVTLKDNTGKEVVPTDTSKIIWSTPNNPIWSGTGTKAFYLNNTQGSFTLNAVYNGDIYTDVDTGDMTPITVNLSASAIVNLVYSNVNSAASGQTDYYNMSNHQFLSSATGAEIYHTNEGGTDYINAPYGMAHILDSEIDPYTGDTNWHILGSILKVPDGLTLTDTKKLPLVNYGVYIVQLSGGGYAKVQADVWGSIMWILYSTSDTTDFDVHY